jgi:hypothetical protein
MIAPPPSPWGTPSIALYLLAFVADAVTGDLRLVEARGILPGWRFWPPRLAADPRGRFVYAALPNADPGSGPTHTLWSFAVEGSTGRLPARGDAWVTLPPVSIAATEDRVHVLGAAYISGYIGSWHVFAVDGATGALRRGMLPPHRVEPSFVVAGVDSGIAYTVAAPSAALKDDEAMFASRWRDESTLVDVDSIGPRATWPWGEASPTWRTSPAGSRGGPWTQPPARSGSSAASTPSREAPRGSPSAG